MFSLLWVNTLAVGLLDHVVSIHFVKKKNKKKNSQTVLLEWLYMILAYNKGRKEKKYTLLFREKKKSTPQKKAYKGENQFGINCGLHFCMLFLSRDHKIKSGWYPDFCKLT